MAEAVGIKDKSFHCLRHTCITRWQKQFKDEGLAHDEALVKIGKLVGHSEKSTTAGSA